MMAVNTAVMITMVITATVPVRSSVAGDTEDMDVIIKTVVLRLIFGRRTIFLKV